MHCLNVVPNTDDCYINNGLSICINVYLKHRCIHCALWENCRRSQSYAIKLLHVTAQKAKATDTEYAAKIAILANFLKFSIRLLNFCIRKTYNAHYVQIKIKQKNIKLPIILSTSNLKFKSNEVLKFLAPNISSTKSINFLQKTKFDEIFKTTPNLIMYLKHN